jgi:peptide/nickel transport system permease protein
MGASALFAVVGILPDWTTPLAWIFLALSIGLVAVYIVGFQRSLLTFLARRMSLMLVSFVGITILTFTIIRLAPGDPVSMELGMGAEGKGIDSSKLTRDPGQAIRERLHMVVKHPFKAVAGDPDGDEVKLVFTWGDGTPETQAEKFVASGGGQTVEHYFPNEGDYEVRVRALDSRGFESAASAPHRITIRERWLPPKRPTKPSGAIQAKVGDELPYSASAESSDGLPVSLRFDWGDGDFSPPTDPQPSGATGQRTHKFMKSGRFELRVMALGRKNARSDWSEPLVVLVEDPNAAHPRPAAPKGLEYVHSSEEPEYATRAAVDADVELDWGDGTSTRVKPDAQGVARAKHKFSTDGQWIVRARHVSDKGNSDWSSELTVRSSTRNRRPDVPAGLTGPVEGAIRTSIAYQYFRWLADLVRLDFGRSTSENKDVLVMIKERLPRTLFLDLVAFTLIYLIAVPIGIFSSTHRGTIRDRLITVFLFMLYSLPTFWVGTMLIVLATPWKGLPIGNVYCSTPEAHYTGFGSHLFLTFIIAIVSFVGFFRWEKTRNNPFLCSLGAAAAFFLLYFLLPMPWARLLPATAQDKLWHGVLPIIVLTYPGLAALSRYARSGMLDVVRQDYIRTARAKGLSENAVIFKHALRNGMIPILTLMATILPAMISGSIVVEWIFNVQGMGLMAYDGVTKRDYPVIMAVTTISAVLTLVGLLISDILYVLVDPRISFEGKHD